MRVTATAPCRLSLFGGGTDLPVYFNKYGGIVISMAINIRQHITISDESNVYSYIEGANPKFYDAFFKEMDFRPSSMLTSFDTHIESGLGSSASAAVALVGAIDKFLGLGMNRREIVEKAWDVEVNHLGLYGGKQDQYAAAWGGLNVMWFSSTVGTFRKDINGHKRDYLLEHILLFDTGESRKEEKIQEELKSLNNDQLMALHLIKKYANLARKAIECGDVMSIGSLLNEAWEFKKKSNPKMSNEKIDRIYEEAMIAGATGGKLMGSGGGGFMFFFVEPRFQSLVIKALEDLGCKHIDFSVDDNGLDVRRL